MNISFKFSNYSFFSNYFVTDAARTELAKRNETKKNCYNFVVEYDEESDTELTSDGKALASMYEPL